MCERGQLKRTLQAALLLAYLVTQSTEDVFSSSVKMVELSRSERQILDKFKRMGIDYESSLQNFVESRREARSIAEDASSHPNGAYLLVKAFVERWNSIISARNDLKETMAKTELPTSLDLDGTLAALLRLQRIYNLTAFQVYTGNLSGFTGPRLTPNDAWALGRRAFMDGMLKLSVEWLILASNHMKDDAPGVGFITASKHSSRDRAQLLGLLGRNYIRLGDRHGATRLYHESALLAGAVEGDVQALGTELNAPNVENTLPLDADHRLDGMQELCTRDKDHIVGKLQRYHRCRYKPSLHVPYRKYKEEILSLAPFASIFHDVLSDWECEALKEMSLKKLGRAGVYFNSINQEDSKPIHYRTADLSWIADMESPVVHAISRRVMDITWLEASDRNASEFASAESMQVLNYGLGGHFSSHLDTFMDSSPRVIKSGIRIATFLFYLETVEVGGHTAFLDADISVPPVKGRGLFWYNALPNGEIDTLTTHAGCPVLKGHKWIANKWIWTEGNMYRRPCGHRPNSSQLEVEKITYSRRHNIPFL